MTADLSIVVINYNTHELVRDCLRSLLKTGDGLALQTIVVDNASPRPGIEEVCAMLKDDFARAGHELRLIRSPKNLGFTGGNNLGLRESTAPVLMLLNNDTVVHEGCLQRALAYLAEHPEAGIAGPRLLNPDGTHQASCRRFPSFRTALFNRYSMLTRLFPENRWSREYLMTDASKATEPLRVDWVSGAALVITRECMARIGLLDERFFMYAEDVDWCKRARDAGFEVVYLPRAHITHYIGQSSAHLPFRTIWWRHRSMWQYYYKHYSRRVALFDWLTLLGIAGRGAFKVAQAAVGSALAGRRRPA